MNFASRPLLAVAAAIVVALAAGTSGLASPALAAPSAASTAPSAASTGSPAASTGPVSVAPAKSTPALAKTKSVQIIRQIVQCGTMMYAVGRFSQITQKGVPFTRPGVFSFSATSPYTLSSLDADVNGEVNSIAFVNNNCSDAYIGGSFTSVNGTPATNIAEIDTTTGMVVPGFGHDANGEVDTLLGYQNHLLAGGKFTKTNGTSRSYFESLNPSTGAVDNFVNLNVKGRVYGMGSMVYNQQLSHGGTLDLVEGNFTSVGGKSRQQIFMLNLAGSTATVTGWTSPEFSHHCKSSEAFYVRSAAWSPNDSTIYIADTGDHPLNWVKGSFPLTGLCDAAASFSAGQTSVSANWIEYTGCDSYFSVAADSSAVYAAGHPRWAENQNGCNRAGKGAVADPGLQGLSLVNATVLPNSRGTPKYHMSRANADSMLITGAGLWIASSNRYGSQSCDGASGHAGICFLPYTP
jgi:hypothetical protein